MTNFVENEHGFASYSIDGKILNIANVYGEGNFWDGFFVELAKLSDCNKIRFATRRSKDAWERKFGVKCVGYILEREV